MIIEISDNFDRQTLELQCLVLALLLPFPEYFTQKCSRFRVYLISVIVLHFLNVATAILRGLYPASAEGLVRISYHFAGRVNYLN